MQGDIKKAGIYFFHVEYLVDSQGTYGKNNSLVTLLPPSLKHPFQL